MEQPLMNSPCGTAVALWRGPHAALRVSWVRAPGLLSTGVLNCRVLRRWQWHIGGGNGLGDLDFDAQSGLMHIRKIKMCWGRRSLQDAKHMSGNIYMNFMYVTLVEIPAILILIPLAKLISRRLLLGLDYA